MDSISNLSLLEIAGEDDSLLLEVPAARDGSSASTAADVFSCSPLLSLRSLPLTERNASAADSENPNSSPKHGVDKENVNWSKSEEPKLSVEPQQMKRKKKGGGYNLRKSLAWDQAFFTEEGVLNPLELSMISGIATPTRSKPELDIIHEEEPTSASSALLEIEENLFKQSSDGVCNEQRNICVGLPPKSSKSTKDIASASLTKRKVPAANDVVGDRSKRNVCPRPVASSSVRRPDTAKASSKELKVARIPARKPNVSVTTTTIRSGSLSTVSVKRSQNANPVTNVQKYAGAKATSNPRTLPSNPKVHVADKHSITKTLTNQAGKHLDNSVSEKHPPYRLHQPETGANKVTEACLPQGVSDTGEKKQQAHFQITKPSGLRMPSPSLGFFSQTKASSSDNQSQKTYKPGIPAQSSIPKQRKLEANTVNEVRPPHAPSKRCGIVKGTAKTCTDKSSLSDVKSELSMQVDNKQLDGAEVESDALHLKQIREQEVVDNKQMAGITLQCDSIGFEKISKQEVFESDNISEMEGVEFPSHGKKLLPESYTHDQMGKVTEVPLEDKLHHIFSNGNQTVFQEPQSMDHHSMHRTSIEKDDILNTVHDATGQDEKQISLVTSDVLTSNGSSVLQVKGDTSKDNRHSGEFEENSCMKTALVNSSLSETVLGGSMRENPYKNTGLENDTVGAFGKNGGDAQVHLFNENLSVNCDDSTQSVSDAVNQQLLGEQLKTLSPSIVGENSSNNGNESHGNSCKLVHLTTLSFEDDSPEKAIPAINTTCESELKVDEVEECRHPVDGQSGFIHRSPVDEGCDQVIVSKAMHERTQAFELDVTHFVSSESRAFYENNVENLHFISQRCPMVKTDCDPRENDITINNDCTISQLELGDNGSSRDTSMLETDSGPMENDMPINKRLTISELERGDNGSSRDTSMHCQHEVDGQSGFIGRTPVDEGYDQVIDSKAIHESTQAFELDKLWEDCLSVSATSCSTEMDNISSESRSFYENNVENIHFTYQLCPMVKADCDSSENDKAIGNNCTVSQLDLRDNGSCSDTTMLKAESDSRVNDMPINDHGTISELEPGDNDSSRDTSMDCLHPDDGQSGFIHRIPVDDVDEGYGQVTDSKAMHESTQAFKLDMMCEDSITVSATACSTDMNNVSSESRPNYENNVENIHYTSHLCPMGKADCDDCTISQLELGDNGSSRDILMLNVDSDSRENDMPIDNHCATSELDLGDNGSSRVTSTHCDVQRDVPGNIEQQASTHAYSKTDEMLCEEESPVGNHGHLLDESEFSEVPAYFISTTKDSICRGAENSSGPLQLTLLAQSIREFDHTSRQSEESHLEDEQVQFSNENLVKYNCNNEHCVSVTSDHFSTDILPSVEVQLNNEVISAEFDSSIKVSEDRITEVVDGKFEERCSFSENSKLPVSDDLTLNTRIPQGGEDSSLSSQKNSEEVETTDMQHQTTSGAEDSSNNIHLKKSETKSKPEVPIVKPPPNAVPFSDEWLAAIEAAGEEILTMKSGAVQNSPPEKPQQEPGPWSPVRRRSQSLGPFDCTKHTNIPNSSP